MKLLTEEIGLEAQQNLGSFDLTEVKALRSHLFRVGHDGVDVRPHKVAECFSSADDLIKHIFLFGLEWQTGNFLLPLNQIFKLWTGCVARDLDTVVTYRACVVVIFFDLATRDL